jgi:large subunit ribosomal protein L28
MANRCEICGKGPMTGNLVSHSNRKTRRVSKPNVQRIRVYVDGVPKRMRVCTRCLRSEKIVKRTR